MSDTPEQQVQADDAQAQAGGTDANAELLNKIALLEANNKKLLNEKKNASASVEDLQRQISDLQNNQQKAKQNQLAESGEFKTLWQDATSTVSSLQDEIAQLKTQLEEKDVAFQQQQIKASALNALSQSGVVNPDQAFSLLKENLRLKDGVPIALAGGVEVPLQQHLESLRTPGSGWEHHFAGSGARGMSAAGSSSSSNGQKSWGSMSLSERISLEMEQPDRAAQLKAAG
jgi:predicted RNase H-like nuclease (RuvC/YqgF family)